MNNLGREKDDIHICKMCEFRYMCFDCRVYITDINDIYSKPLKCKYDVNKKNDESNLRI